MQSQKSSGPAFSRYPVVHFASSNVMLYLDPAAHHSGHSQSEAAGARWCSFGAASHVLATASSTPRHYRRCSCSPDWPSGAVTRRAAGAALHSSSWVGGDPPVGPRWFVSGGLLWGDRAGTLAGFYESGRDFFSVPTFGLSAECLKCDPSWRKAWARYPRPRLKTVGRRSASAADISIDENGREGAWCETDIRGGMQGQMPLSSSPGPPATLLRLSLNEG